MRIMRRPAPLVLAALVAAIAAHATPVNKRQLVSTYKEAKGSKLDACVTCHVGATTDLNPYGADLKIVKASFAQIEKDDSDEDGVSNLDEIKAQQGVPLGLRSCHTALVEGYLVEGHVPAPVIERLLKERPRVTGLAVPGMPVGSPGMEGPNPEPYSVLSFDAEGHVAVYAQQPAAAPAR